MHQETYALLRKSADRLHRFLAEDSDPDLDWLIRLAKAENMLEEHDAVSAVLPSRWATINAADSTGINGEIEAIRGGYRVRWLDSSNGDPSSPMPMSRVMDIFAMQSIDWLTEAEYAAMTADVHKRCQERAMSYTRCRTWPDGYQLVKRTDNNHLAYGVQRLSDNLVMGFWHDCGAPLRAAWNCIDGEPDDFKDWAVPVAPCSEMPIPF